MIAIVTALLALVVGRYAGRRGLIVASLLVCVGSAIILAGRYEGLAYALFLVLNVAIFEIVAVSVMLFFPGKK